MHLLKYFKKLSLRPENAKEIRALILELAIRGRLTEEWRRKHPDVEPASVLLERIREEKARLVRKKVIRKEKIFDPIKESEIPFNIPNKWEWVKLGQAFTYGTKNKAKPESTSSDIWVLELEDVEKHTSRLLKKVRFSEREFKSMKSAFNPGNVIYGKLRPYLDKVIVADEKGVCTTEMIPISVHANTSSEYLRLFLKSNYFIKYANDSTYGMNLPRMGTEHGKNAITALPPLPEQHAIVATVNRLLAEVDELERQTTRFRALRQDYVTSSIRQLTGDDSAGAWAALRPHFQSLFDQQNGVDRLRESILELAVQGKLTAKWRAEHPEVEPASVLLERIGEEKARLVRERVLKKNKPLDKISHDLMPFKIPDSWVWSYFQDIANIASNLVDPQAYPSYPHIAPNVIEKNTGKLLEYRTIEEDGVSSAKHLFRPSQILYSKIRPKLNKAIEVDFVGLCSADMYPIDPFVERSYLLKFMLSSFFLVQSTKPDTRVAMPKINQTELKKIIVPIPPKKEQKVVVKFVDKLLKLCDQLEEQSKNQAAIQEHFLRASREELLLATERAEV
ncbi:type I restriction enzyme S subunit [Lewinella aquimaris]|uniref:Type I restriction enzyme S subunit n=1 Tax=Neolewinella aquimaris TaxID=1835722 RepID=A0A840EHM0_9BACT|nr:restriction endonuclease subunit S [Neolewinella aquimaris]MBB4080396.1 type I restriction enzyme S subunit [Neolewinella aquimaris]